MIVLTSVMSMCSLPYILFIKALEQIAKIMYLCPITNSFHKCDAFTEQKYKSRVNTPINCFNTHLGAIKHM